MIVRGIIYLALTLLVLREYKSLKKKFILKILPIVGLSLFGTTEYFTSLDERLQTLIVVITVLIALNTMYSFYKDYKVERYRALKKMRENR